MVVGADVEEAVILPVIPPHDLLLGLPPAPGRAANILEPFLPFEHGDQPTSRGDRVGAQQLEGACALISEEMTLLRYCSTPTSLMAVTVPSAFGSSRSPPSKV